MFPVNIVASINNFVKEQYLETFRKLFRILALTLALASSVHLCWLKKVNILDIFAG